MSKFRNWYIDNQDQISWFIIGWCSFAALDRLTEADYVWAAVMAVLAWGNYRLANFRLK